MLFLRDISSWQLRVTTAPSLQKSAFRRTLSLHIVVDNEDVVGHCQYYLQYYIIDEIIAAVGVLGTEYGVL